MILLLDQTGGFLVYYVYQLNQNQMNNHKMKKQKHLDTEISLTETPQVDNNNLKNIQPEINKEDNLI